MSSIVRLANNTYSHPRKIEGFVLKNAAAGDVSNDRIKTCYVCKNYGWPHEAITFERIPGRVLSDGHNETKGWIVRDYFTGQIHCHRGNKLKEAASK